MNSIEKQRKLIDQLYHLVDESIKEHYDSASCQFEYFVAKDDGSSSIGSCLLYGVNGEQKSSVLAYPNNNYSKQLYLNYMPK